MGGSILYYYRKKNGHVAKPLYLIFYALCIVIDFLIGLTFWVFVTILLAAVLLIIIKFFGLIEVGQQLLDLFS